MPKSKKTSGKKTSQPPQQAPQEASPEAPTTIALEFDDGRGLVGQPDDFRNMLEEQKAMFRAKFGRDHQPTDPLYFDPDQDTPTLIAREKLPPEAAEAFGQATIHGAMVYAQVKVGFFLSPMNYDVATDEQSQAWEDAVREFVYLKGLIPAAM